MSPKIISKVIDYYFTNPRFILDIDRAFRYFFNVKNASLVQDLGINQTEEGLFNEWFLFNFRLANGKTPLEYFYETNPSNLSSRDLIIYEQLLHNIYSMFEVLKIEFGKGLCVKDVYTGKEYFVSEFTATFALKAGMVLFNRISQIGDHWEFIGSNSFSWDIKFNESVHRYFQESKEKLNPKIINDYFGPRAKKEPESKNSLERYYVNPEQAENKFREFFVKHNLDSFVTVDEIKKWINNLLDIDGYETILSLLTGLLKAPDSADINEISKEFIRLFTDFYNTIPQKKLGNQSPQERKNQDPSRKPEWKFSITYSGDKEWIKHAKKASLCMQRKDYVKSLEEYNQCFRVFLENKTTLPEIYRFFANKAIVHFAIGERWEGEKLLEMALSLNPNYDFARATKQKYKQGEFEDSIGYGIREKIKEAIIDPNHPANRWDFDSIRNRWPIEKIMKTFRDFGIEIDQNYFKEIAGRFVSIIDFAEEILYPKYQGPKEDEDFVWMGAYALFDRWAADSLTIEYLSEIIEKLDQITSKETLRIEKIQKYLNNLSRYVYDGPDALFSQWIKLFESCDHLENLFSALYELLDTEFAEKTLEIAQKFESRVGSSHLALLSIISLLFRGDLSWEKRFCDFIKYRPYDCYSLVYIAHSFNLLGNYSKEEEYLRKALRIVEKREKDKIYDIKNGITTIYDDYIFVLDLLEEFYKTRCDKEKMKEIQFLRKNIEKRQEKLSYSPREEKKGKHLEKIIIAEAKKKFKTDPAYIYWKFLKPFNINFATKNLTTSLITKYGPGGLIHQYSTGPKIRVASNQYFNSKVGRNDPCPCGAINENGKSIKYKHCHGKNT